MRETVSSICAGYGPAYSRRKHAEGLPPTELWDDLAGKGYLGTPGIHTPDHIAAWRTVTDAVHARGGRIVAQIAHAGRISHPLIQAAGRQPVAPTEPNEVGKLPKDPAGKPGGLHASGRGAVALRPVAALRRRRHRAALAGGPAGADPWPRPQQ